MTGSLDLASETLLQICDYLDEWEFHDFTRANKFLFALSMAKRHATVRLTNLKEEFMLPNGDDREVPGRKFHPLAFLHLILSAVRLTAYPKTVILGPWSENAGNTAEFESHFCDAQIEWELCWLMHAKGFVEPKQIGLWYDYVRGKYERPNERRCLLSTTHCLDFAILTVLALLPNVQVIDDKGTGLVAKWLPNTTVKTFQDLLPGDLRLHLDSHRGLERLREVRVHSDRRYETTRHGNMILKLACLPSVTMLHVTDLYLSDWPVQLPEQVQICNPNVQHIYIVSRDPSLDTLNRSIQHLLNLRSFALNQNGICRFSDSRTLWRPSKIIDSLRRVAAHSLEHLTINKWGALQYAPIAQGFRDFLVLKNIEVDAALINYRSPRRYRHPYLPPSGAPLAESEYVGLGDPRMIELLPKSIESFTLVGANNPDQLVTLMDGLMTMKEERLPALTRFTLDESNTGLSEYTVEELASIGISVAQ